MDTPGRSATATSILLLAVMFTLTAWTHPLSGPVSAAEGDPIIGQSTAVAVAPESVTFTLSVTSDEPLARVELLWRAAADQQYSLVRIADLPDGDDSVEYILDTRLNYIPPGVDVHWVWQVTDAGGDMTRSTEDTVTYLDPDEDWTIVTTAEAEVYWSDADQSDADAIVDAVTRTLEIMQERFDVATQRPIRVVLYRNQNTFADALPPGSAEWIGGQAHTDLDIFVAHLIPGSTSEIRRLIPHEIAHLALSQETDNPWTSTPQWLDEGLAVYLQEQEDERLPEVLDDAIDDGRLIPLAALQSAFPWDTERALLSYAESWSVVDYLIGTYGDDGLTRLIDAVADGETNDAALARAFGITLEQLDQDWKASLDYAGDAPPAAPSSATSSDDDLNETEQAVALGVVGFGCILGLGMLIFGIIRFRQVGRR